MTKKAGGAAGAARSVAHQKDFKKLKRKVGKKAPVRANVTNTSFATKTIHVPSQKLHVDNALVSADAAAAESALTNARQANLHDLFGQIKHYNAHVRKDALVGLKDLLLRHPGILVLESASLLQMSLPCILDEDKGVRGALLSLLGWIVPQLGAQALQPFQSLMVSYVCSGLSHMHFAVRRSAMAALRILMDALEKPSTAAAAASSASMPSATAASQASNAAAATASARLLWNNSFRALLPNFVSCLSERVFVTKQNNIGSTELLNVTGGGGGGGRRQSGGASGAGGAAGTDGSAGSNLANRALMLQCLEQFLSLCPYISHASSSATAASAGEQLSDEAEESSNRRSTTLAPHVLHASALHSLAYSDPSSSSSSSATGAAASGGVSAGGASGSLGSLDPWSAMGGMALDSAGGGNLAAAAARPVPQKYARKHVQQNKFFSAASVSTAGAAGQQQQQLSEREKAAQALTGFVHELLPLCIEYYLESFGLAGAAGGSAGGASSASGASAAAADVGGAGLSGGMKSKDSSELLSNLFSILRVVRACIDILRAQRLERVQVAAIESGVVGGSSGTEDGMQQHGLVSEADLNLPPGFATSLRGHIFASFPLGSGSSGSGAQLLLNSATSTEQHYRALNAINAECVAIMSAFIPPPSIGNDLAVLDTNVAGAASAEGARRKSGGGAGGAAAGRAARQAAEDASTWLAAVLRYMGDSFASLTEHAQAKEAARQHHAWQQQQQQMQDGSDDVHMADDAAAAAASTAAAAAPVTPARHSYTPAPGRSAKKKSGGGGGGGGGGTGMSASSARMLEHGSLAELLPLLQSLLPRLSSPQQDWLIGCFSNFYLAVHPLSAAKLACLRFLHDFLLVPTSSSSSAGSSNGGLDPATVSSECWMHRASSLRHIWIDQGEWTDLLLRVAAEVVQQQAQLKAKREEEQTMHDGAVAGADAVVASFSSSASASPAVLSRSVEMLDLLLNMLLNAGRIFHGQGVLDYNVLQEQLLPFFGERTIADEDEEQHKHTSTVTPGPFWSLPPALQHKSVQLLYYFDALHPVTLQLLLDCLRDHTAPDSAVVVPLESKLLVLDLLEEKRRQARASGVEDAKSSWPLMHYVSFMVGALRTDLATNAPAASGSGEVFDSQRVSPLLPTVCRMMRSITADEVDAALLAQSAPSAAIRGRGAAVHTARDGTSSSHGSELASPPGVLLELLAPVLSASMESAMRGITASAVASSSASSTSSAPKLDALSALVLLDALLAHSDVPALPSSLDGGMLASLLYALLVRSVTGSMLESGLVRASIAGSNWLSSAPVMDLVHTKPWLLAMRLLCRTAATSNADANASPAPLSRLLSLMQQTLSPSSSSSSATASAALAVVVVFGALLQGAGGMRELLQRAPYRAAVLALAATVQRTQGIASQTLMAQLQAELQLLFGRQAVQV